MAIQTLKTVYGNTAPPLDITVKRSGVVVDLTGCAVSLIITSGTTITNTGHQTCTIVNTTGGEIKYTRQAGDTPTKGRYLCDVKVTYGDATVEYIYDQLRLVCRKKAGDS